MRVLFLGERIRDVYHYGRVLGRPLKEPILCFDEDRTEVFEGGVLAAAEHVKGFCEVRVVSFVGIEKQRWVDESHTRKLFEVYSKPCNLGKEPFSYDYEMVVVTDYGHGMFSPEFVREICGKAKYLAVNVQTNAGNYGFNLATKWPRCDFLCVDEAEARLATGNQSGPIEESLYKLGAISKKVVITLGSKGSIGLEGTAVLSPALTDKVVDTMGAGDAFFALTAIFSKELGMEKLLRLGNAAGAMKAQIVGHRKSLKKEDLLEFI